MKRLKLAAKRLQSRRCGGIIVMAALTLTLIFAFAAFSVDVGLITLVKCQLQNAADGSALAAAQELVEPLSQGTSSGTFETLAALVAATTAAKDVALHNPSGFGTPTVLVPGDIVFGNRSWDDAAGEWVINWGSAPFNAVRVKARRLETRQNALPLLFAPVINHQSSDLTQQATAALMPGTGISSGGGGNAPILPFAVDLDSWNAFASATSPDDWSYDPVSGSVSAGPDGIPEFHIFPNQPNTSLPSGNRGTINIGDNNNSTNVLRRQIREGINQAEMNYHGGSIDFANGPISFTGDTGLSASMQSDLQMIYGESRALVLFTEVSGNGANAVYTTVRFAGARVMYAKLTGPMSKKAVVVQPASLFDSKVIAGPTDTTLPGTIYTKPRLVE